MFYVGFFGRCARTPLVWKKGVQNQFKIGSKSVRNRFEIGSNSVRNQFGIGSGPIFDQIGTVLGSFFDQILIVLTFLSAGGPQHKGPICNRFWIVFGPLFFTLALCGPMVLRTSGLRGFGELEVESLLSAKQNLMRRTLGRIFSGNFGTKRTVPLACTGFGTEVASESPKLNEKSSYPGLFAI